MTDIVLMRLHYRPTLHRLASMWMDSARRCNSASIWVICHRISPCISSAIACLNHLADTLTTQMDTIIRSADIQIPIGQARP
ncbi:hypothetical protein SAMN04515620_1472 [Collimonas sp. OK607]|nr:hypothetical protein SAMN04515620_1472 [Collimonas sp. OK607]